MASLTGSSAVSYSTLNLSSPVQTDWIQYPGSTTPNRKAGAGSTIGAVTPTSGATLDAYLGSSTAVTWTDGSPNASSTTSTQVGVIDSPKGIATPAAGQGYTFTVPADTNTRTLQIVWGAYSNAPKLTATLSDGSAAPFTVTPAGPGSGSSENYLTTITYSAASSNQTLTIAVGVVTPATGAYANVTFQAAAYTTTLATITGTGAVTQAKNTVVGTGAPSVTGAGSTAQLKNSAVASGSPVVSGAAAVTEIQDSAAGIGAPSVVGSSAVAQNRGTVAGAGSPSVSGSAAASQATNTILASGVVTSLGSGSASQVSNAIAGFGSTAISGSGAPAQHANTAAGSGSPISSGSAAASQASNSTAASGSPLATGSAAMTQAPNSAVGSGAAGDSPVGAGSAVQQPNVASGSGTVAIGGSGVGAQSGNALAAVGSVAASGVGILVQVQNTAAGIAAAAVTGSGSVVQAANVSYGTGTVLSTITGVGAAVQAPNTANGAGTATSKELPDAASASARTYRIQADSMSYQVVASHVPTFTKDPIASLDFYWDWSAWLGSNEGIDTLTITADDGLAVSDPSSKDGVATAWISGGSAGTDYAVACTIKTPTGRMDTRRIRVGVRLR